MRRDSMISTEYGLKYDADGETLSCQFIMTLEARDEVTSKIIKEHSETDL